MNLHDEPYDDSEIAGEPFVPEPFSVDIFSERHRFSPPASVQFFQHLFRWSIYVFLPFFAFLALAGLAVFLIIHPIKAPLDTTQAVNIAAVIFFGMIIPAVLLMMWVRSLPWWFLNGTERSWQTFQLIAEANGHRFPNDFWHPFIHNGFGLQVDTFGDAFAEELTINSKTDIEGFIGADINISYKDKAFVANKPIDHFGFYLDSAYWRLEQYGLRFYGERMNIFVPYWAIQKVRKGLLWCNIVLKLDTTNYFDTQIFGHWTEICISIGHLPTMREDRLLRDELYRRIVNSNTVAKVAFLAQVADIRSRISHLTLRDT